MRAALTLMIGVALSGCASGRPPFAGSGPSASGLSSGAGGASGQTARVVIEVEGLDLHLERARIEVELPLGELARVIEAAASS